MDPIAKTAWYCCGVRALDARRAQPLCGDTLAARFMDECARDVLDRFATMGDANLSTAVRHRLIDDLLRERLQARPAQPVLLLGAGFDTRAYRLAGGDWLELDQPALITLKERTLPASQAPNPLQRVPIDFAADRLADKLGAWAGRRDVVVVMEGVSMYLPPAQWQQTAQTLRALLPGHLLVCDLVDASFMRRYGGRLRRAIREIGGDFAPLRRDPVAAVTAQGYRLLDAQSVVGRTAELGAVPIPRWLLASLLRSLRDGYQVYRFEATA